MSYPSYDDWVCKVRQEIESGWKKSILAFSDGVLVGDLVFQPHKDFPKEFLELKNLRIHPEVCERYFGVFMLKQAEAEARGRYQGIICDVRSNQHSMINLLEFMGYKELCRAPLYDANVEDVVFFKLAA